MPRENSFSDYVLGQVMRLSALPGFPQHGEGIRELREICDAKAQQDRFRVKAVIDEAVDFDRCPTPRDLRAVWLRKYPAPTGNACVMCRGTTGWIRTTDYAGNSAVKRCPCGAVAKDFQQMSDDEREHAFGVSPQEAETQAAENNRWFGEAMARLKHRRVLGSPKRDLAQIYPDAETIAERDAISREGA